MGTEVVQNKNEVWSIEKLRVWDKNPRSIKEDDFERLKQQIKKLGIYKPLVVTADGTVLGGNMRLRALQDLGEKDVWVSVVEAADETTKVEYALSDNDRAGEYDVDQLAELVADKEIDIKLYKVDLGTPQTLDNLSNFREMPTDEDWAAAFESETMPKELEGLRQVTFILHKDKIPQLIEKLKATNPDKNKALLELLGL